MRTSIRRFACIVLPVGFGVCTLACAPTVEQTRRREAAYQTQLATFSAAFKPGMSRQDVETELRKRGREFHRMCCLGPSKNAYDDLTKIGQERHPWYCSAHTVYIGFEFVSDGKHEFAEAHNADTLRSVQIYHSLQGCL